jgi:hypothetical protein
MPEMTAKKMMPLLLITILPSSITCRGLRYEEAMPSMPPGKTKRQCHVHHCKDGPRELAQVGKRRSHKRRGHMQPMGQQADMREVPRENVTSPAEFYQRFVAGSAPVIVAGAAAEATRGRAWTDEFLLDACTLEASSDDRFREGEPWRATIEVNKVIVTNTRYPLRHDWNFCDFIQNYTKPEHADGLYCISPLTDPGVKLGKHVDMPSVLRCGEIHESVHETRLWMSSGNTSSSLHFDTHENLMLQVEGSKTIVFWPPGESHLTYMDYHNRFGLSPVNPDHVDLDRFPLFAAMRGGMVAHLHKGDGLLIPDGWWHQVRTWPGKNIAVTYEFEPYEGLERLWPDGAFERYVADPKWSSQVRAARTPSPHAQPARPARTPSPHAQPARPARTPSALSTAPAHRPAAPPACKHACPPRFLRALGSSPLPVLPRTHGAGAQEVSLQEGGNKALRPHQMRADHRLDVEHGGHFQM